MRPPCGRRGVARPSPSLWPLARPPVAAQRAGCRRAWDEGERIPARSRTPQPDRPERPRGATGREPRARRWRSGALPRWEERGLSGPVPLPPRALGSAPAGSAGWWGWSSAGTRSSSARLSRSPLVYTFCAFVGVEDDSSTSGFVRSSPDQYKTALVVSPGHPPLGAPYEGGSFAGGGPSISNPYSCAAAMILSISGGAAGGRVLASAGSLMARKKRSCWAVVRLRIRAVSESTW